MEKNEKKIKIKKTEYGGKYYETLPPGTRLATLDDFYDHHGRLIINKPYLVQSMINPVIYWANRVNHRFPYHGSDFKLFLDGELVFVWEG